MNKSGFFNSRNGDRVYTASDLNNFVDGLLGDGVFKNYDDTLEVTAGNGMAVSVAGGKAIVKGHYVTNTSVYELTIDGAGTYPRVDTVVVGVDTSTDARTGDIYIIKGTESSTPEMTPPVRTTTKKELVLASVYVAAGATSVTVTDLRGDETVCGYVRLTNISASIDKLQERVTVVPSEMSNPYLVPIGIAGFNPNADIANVALNGIELLEGEDYAISTHDGVRYVQFTHPLTGSLSQAVDITVTRMII